MFIVSLALWLLASALAEESCVGGLKRRLLQSYDPLALPVRGGGAALSVNVSGVQVKDLKIEELRNEMHLHGWFVFSWRDEYLTWPEGECGLESVVLGQGEFWHPDFEVFNRAGPPDSPSFPFRSSVLHPRGHVVSVSDSYTRTACTVDLSEYPYDSHVCSLVVGSWTRNARELDVNVGTTDLVEVSERASPTWRVEKISFTKNVKTYTDGEVYSDVVLTLRVARSRPDPLVFYFPLVVVTLLCLLMLCLPVTSHCKLAVAAVDLVLIQLHLLQYGSYVTAVPTPGFVLYLYCLEAVVTASALLCSPMLYFSKRPPDSLGACVQTFWNHKAYRCSKKNPLAADFSVSTTCGLEPSEDGHSSFADNLVSRFYLMNWLLLIVVCGTIVALWFKFIPIK